jgi:hypothetical protein
VRKAPWQTPGIGWVLTAQANVHVQATCQTSYLTTSSVYPLAKLGQYEPHADVSTGTCAPGQVVARSREGVERGTS